MSSTSEEVKPKFPWLLVLLISILLPIISTFWWSLETGAWSAWAHLAPSQTVLQWPAVSVIVPLVIIGFSWLFKKPISLRTLTFAYVTSMMALTYTSMNIWSFTGYMHARENPLHDMYLPTFWVPAKEVVSKMFTGGQSVDWAAWAPNVLFWWLIPVFYWCFFAGGATIFRHAWIVSEAIPYPYGLSAFTMVHLTTTKDEKLSTQKRFFTYAFAIGFIFFLPFTLANLFPELPDIYGWTRAPWQTWCPGSVEILDVYPSLRSIIGLGQLSFNPMVAALLFFAPLSTLFSTWFFFLVIIVVIQILYAMGYYSGAESLGSWARADMFVRGDPLNLGPFTMLGVLPGILIWWIVMNRRYVVSTLRLAMGRGSADEKALEAGDVSYRYSYLTLIIGFIGLLTIFVSSGIEPAVTMTYLIGVGITHIAMIRIHGFLGPRPEFPYWIQGFGKWRYPSVTTETRDQSQAMLGAISGWWYTDGKMGWGEHTMDGFRFSQDAGVEPRSVFMAMLIATLIGPLVGFITFITWSHYYGVMKLPFPHESDFCMFGIGDPEQWNVLPTPGVWWPHALLGFVVSGALMFLRIRVPWLPLEPYGLVLATSHYVTWSIMGIASVAFIAWFVKTIIVRVGGADAYRNYGMPAAAGIIAGWAIAVPLLAGLGGMLRFFFPA